MFSIAEVPAATILITIMSEKKKKNGEGISMKDTNLGAVFGIKEITSQTMNLQNY